MFKEIQHDGYLFRALSIKDAGPVMILFLQLQENPFDQKEDENDERKNEILRKKKLDYQNLFLSFQKELLKFSIINPDTNAPYGDSVLEMIPFTKMAEYYNMAMEVNDLSSKKDESLAGSTLTGQETTETTDLTSAN